MTQKARQHVKAESCSLMLWSVWIPLAALHPVSRRRSCFWFSASNGLAGLALPPAGVVRLAAHCVTPLRGFMRCI